MKLRRVYTALASAFLLFSCADMDRTLVDTQPATVESATPRPGLTSIAFSLPGAPRLSKSAPQDLDTLTTSKRVDVKESAVMSVSFAQTAVALDGGLVWTADSQGSQLDAPVVQDPATVYPVDSAVRVHDAVFRILRKSIGGPPAEGQDAVHITMAVQSGLLLSDVQVAFTPSGLTFKPTASLSVRLSGPLTPSEIIVYHIYEDGTVVEIVTSIQPDGDLWRVDVDVPGFSEYSWDDGDY